MLEIVTLYLFMLNIFKLTSSYRHHSDFRHTAYEINGIIPQYATREINVIIPRGYYATREIIPRVYFIMQVAPHINSIPFLGERKPDLQKINVTFVKNKINNRPIDRKSVV